MTHLLDSTRPLTLTLLAAALALQGCSFDMAGPASPKTQPRPRQQATIPPDSVAAQAQAFADRFERNTAPPAATNTDEVSWLNEPAPGYSSRHPFNDKPRQPVRINRAALADQTPPTPEPEPMVEETVEPAKPAPAPVAEAAPPTRDQLLQQLSEQLADDAHANRATLKPYLARAALGAIDPSYALTPEELAALSPDDQRIVLAYQRSFSLIAKSTGDSHATDRQALAEIASELADQIDSSQTLSIKTAKLCRKVSGFGVYDEISRYTFLAGRQHPVIVYVELDNFRSELRDGDSRVVELAQEIVLYNDSDGLPVWRQKPVTITDSSRNERRDFFVVQIINLSSRLTVGKYDMKITMTDRIGSSVDEITVPIEVVADPGITALTSAPLTAL